MAEMSRYVTGWLLRKQGWPGWLFFHKAEDAYAWKDTAWAGAGYVEHVSHFDTRFSLHTGS
jgi:hypothetical protein